MILTHFEHQFDLAPHPKQRARQGQGRTYTPIETARFERQLGFLIKSYIGPRDPFDGPVSVTLAFFFKRAEKSNFDYPVRGDLDNYVKATTDAANKILWRDDRQICELIARKCYAPKPAIFIQVKPMEITT